MNKNIKKRIIIAVIWSVSLYAAETWTYKKEDIWRLEAFEMWVYRRDGKDQLERHESKSRGTTTVTK